jgi:putative transposase
MNSARSRYHGYRFPPEIISYAVGAYHLFCLSLKIFWPNEESLFLTKSSGSGARNSDPTMPDVLRRNRHAWVIPWGAVGQDGDVIDILLLSRRDRRAAERFLRRLLRGQGKQPFRIITDKLKSYAAAGRTTLPGVTHDSQQSLRDFASAHSDERTTNAPIQITPTSSALSITPPGMIAMVCVINRCRCRR